MQRSKSNTHFVGELRSLLRAPYALIHVETHEEERAVNLLRHLASEQGATLREWSSVTGFEGSASNGDIVAAMRVIDSAALPGVFVLKDAARFFSDHVMRRRLRELAGPAATFGKTVVLLGPERVEGTDLEKEMTRLSMPLPDRATIADECDTVFDMSKYVEIDRETLISGAMGLTVKQAHRAYHRVREQYDEACERNAIFDLESSLLLEKQRIVGANDVLEFHALDAGLESVGGLDELKLWLADRQGAFSQRARDFGLPAPKGLLLLGVQGCGKSLSAKVIGRHWGLPLLRIDLGSVFDGRRSPEEALQTALKACDALAPCVLWIDEIEKGFADTRDGRSGRVLGSLLTWQQEKESAVFLVATANSVDHLPPELIRKGRFDEIFFVDLPDPHERAEILRIHLEARGRSMDDETIQSLVARTEFFSGAELESAVVSAMYSAFAASREVTPEDLTYALRGTIPLYRTYEEDIKRLREWADGRARRASRKRKVLDFFPDQSTQ